MSQPNADTYAADRWFLSSGLPAVVHRSALLRRVWSRSAPALVGLAVIAANSILIVAISGQHTVDIAGRPDAAESFVLGLLTLTLPAAVLAGWLVAKIESPAGRSVAATAALAVIVLGALLGGPSQRPVINMVFFGVAVGLILLLTATGVGSILGGPAAAFLKQATGSWTAVFIVVAVLDAVTALLAITVLRTMRRRHLAEG